MARSKKPRLRGVQVGAGTGVVSALLGSAVLCAAFPSVAFSATRPTRADASGASRSSQPVMDPLATVSQFSGFPFLHEAKWEKGGPLRPRRLTQDAIYNGKRTRVIRLEQGLPLYAGDSIETPADASIELLFPSGHVVLVHPGSQVQLQDSPLSVDVRRGRVTLLTVNESSSRLVLSSTGQQFENLETGSFVEVSEKGVTQGNELRAHEFVGFDDLKMDALSGVSNEPETAAPSRLSNPLDDVGDDNPRGETEKKEEQETASVRAENPSHVRGAANEKGWFSLGVGKVMDTSGNALASKIWSLHGNGLVWMGSAFGLEAAFDFFPQVEAGASSRVRSHARWNGLLGLRISSPPNSIVRFFLSPQLGLMSLQGEFDVGAARDGTRVFSNISIGPNVVYGLRTGADAQWEAWRFAGAGFGAVRYSADKVALRFFAVEASAGYSFGPGGVGKSEPFLHPFLFMRYESFRTEKVVGSLGRKSVATSWSLAGLGARFAF